MQAEIKEIMAKATKVALIYDFDETLSITYMQDYVLIPTLGMKPQTFWDKANAWSRDHCADQVTGSMYYFTMTARKKGIRLTREFFCDAGKTIEYFDGVEEWFDRINEYGRERDLEIEHYIISSGYEEIIAGASIRPLQGRFRCSFALAKTDRPVWPARVVTIPARPSIFPKSTKDSANWKTGR